MATEVDQTIIGCQYTFSYMWQHQNEIPPMTRLDWKQQRHFEARDSVTDVISQEHK